MKTSLVHTLMVAALAPFAVSGCAEEKPLYVDQAWVRLNAAPDAPAAGYFTIHGGPVDSALRKVTAAAAVRVEMHDTVMKNGMMSMQPVTDVPVASGQTVKFEPGGKHIMLWQINPAAVEAGKIELKLLFASGEAILVDAVIRPAGSPAPDGAAKGGTDEHVGH